MGRLSAPYFARRNNFSSGIGQAAAISRPAPIGRPENHICRPEHQTSAAGPLLLCADFAYAA